RGEGLRHRQPPWRGRQQGVRRREPTTSGPGAWKARLTPSEVVLAEKQQDQDQEDHKDQVVVVLPAIPVCHPRASFRRWNLRGSDSVPWVWWRHKSGSGSWGPCGLKRRGRACGTIGTR